MNRLKNRYQSLLEEKVGLFNRVKKEFGISSGLGLASVPWAHFYPTNGVLLPYKKVNGSEFFRAPGPLGFKWFRFSTINVVIVPPKGNTSLYVVSVYHQTPDRSDEDPLLENITDNALAGLFAHECAEYQICLGTKEFEEIKDPQQRADAIAQSRGFGDALISFFELKIDYLNRDNGKTYKGFYSERLRTDQHIEELRARIEALKERAA